MLLPGLAHRIYGSVSPEEVFVCCAPELRKSDPKTAWNVGAHDPGRRTCFTLADWRGSAVLMFSREAHHRGQLYLFAHLLGLPLPARWRTFPSHRN